MQDEPKPADDGGQTSLIRNITWLGAANALVKPFWFIFITALCMRLMGVEQYGLMNASLSLTLIATSILNLGMTRYSVLEISRTPSRASEFFSNFMVLRIGNSLVAWAGAVVVAWWLGYSADGILAVIFAGVYAVSLNIQYYCRGMYQALANLRLESIMLVVEKVLVISMGAAMLLFTRTAHWTLAGIGAGMTITTIINILWIDRRIARLDLSLVSRRFLAESVRKLVPFGLAALFAVVYYRVDMVMIEAMLGEIPTGQYGAAFRILEALNMLPGIVATAGVYPRLARLQGLGDFKQFGRVLKLSSAGLVTASILIATTLFLTASFVISMLDPSPDFVPAGGALSILVWSYPFFCANSLLYAALVSFDDQIFISWFLLAALFLNVGINLLLIPAIGIDGAAIATVAPEVVLTGVYLARFLYRWRRVTRTPSSERDVDKQ